MFTPIVVIITLVVMFAALTYKQPLIQPVLHGLALIGWLLTTVLLIVGAVASYPGTIIPLAAGLFGFSGVIVETVLILLPYLKDRKSDSVLYNERQVAFKKQIVQMNAKRKPKMWWE